MILVGLTGGIAVGKSNVSKTFMKHNIPVIDADVLAREVVTPGSIGLNKIISHFGTSYLNKDETLNRVKLGDLIFSNKNELNWINNTLGPLIDELLISKIELLKEQDHSLVIYDAALIIENGNADKYRPLILVGCNKENQILRLMMRNNFTLEQAKARISCQLSLEEKMKYADYFIDTNNEIEKTIKKTESIISLLKQM